MVMDNVIKIFIARSVVIGGLSYLLLGGKYVGADLWDCAVVGATGAAGSIVSQCYVENSPMLQ